jgi:hypothetical protein
MRCKSRQWFNGLIYKLTIHTATVISQGTYPARKAVISAIGKITSSIVIAVCDDLLLGLSIILYFICDFEIDKFDSNKKIVKLRMSFSLAFVLGYLFYPESIKVFNLLT